MAQRISAPKKEPTIAEMEYTERFSDRKMDFYRMVYRKSPKWDGNADLKNKTVIIYFEQGLGDAIHFVRYIPSLKSRGCNVVFHVSPSLFDLFEQFGPVQQIDKYTDDLPAHDFHIPSMSLPFLLGAFHVDTPYIFIKEKFDVGFEDCIKIGIAWEGNPEHSNNNERCCPLKNFLKLKHEKIKLFMLQKEVHLPELIEGAEEIDLYGHEINTFVDTAKLINAMDYVISVDTSILHLTGALGKDCCCLLSKEHDGRWDVVQWYPTITFAEQTTKGNWDLPFYETICEVANKFNIPELIPNESPASEPLVTVEIKEYN